MSVTANLVDQSWLPAEMRRLAHNVARSISTDFRDLEPLYKFDFDIKYCLPNDSPFSYILFFLPAFGYAAIAFEESDKNLESRIPLAIAVPICMLSTILVGKCDPVAERCQRALARLEARWGVKLTHVIELSESAEITNMIENNPNKIDITYKPIVI